MKYNLRKPGYDINVKKITNKNIGLLIVQGDSFYQGKVCSIIDYLNDNMLFVLDYEIKQLFHEDEKEAMYIDNLNNDKISWWFSKETFSLGPSLALILTHKNPKINIYDYLKTLKGTSEPKSSKSHSIRNEFSASCLPFNLVHTSDNISKLIFEGSLFFSSHRLLYFLNNSNLKPIKIEIIKEEVLLFSKSCPDNKSLYISFLEKIIQRILRYRRDNLNYNESSPYKTIKSDRTIKIYETFIIEEGCNINIEANLESISITLLLKSCSRIISRDLSNFSWPKFWKVLEINEILISENDRILITGIINFNSI